MARERFMEEEDTTETERGFTRLGTLKPDEEYIHTQAGNREIGIPWPKDRSKGVERMRDILSRVEHTNEPDGGLVNSEELRLLGRLISGLSRAEKEEDKVLGEKMYAEFEARTTFHAVYLKYIQAPDAASVKNILEPMKKEYLNTLFRDTPAVWEAFLGYEANAKEFLRAREATIAGEGSKSQVREKIARKVSLDLTDSEDNWEKFLWAQNIAERLWSVTGRRAAHDELQSKDPAVNIEEAKAKGDLTWLDADATGGETAIRKINRVNDWVLTQKKDLRLFTELATDVDLSSKDFFSTLPGSVESYYRGILMNQYTNQRVTNPKQSAELEAERMVSEMFRGLQKVPKKGKLSITDGGAWDDQEWPRGRDLTTALQGIVWEDRKIDFGMMADIPLNDWAYANLDQPDKARDALVSYLRNPSDESLGKLSDVFAYQKGGQYETKRKLLENYVDFRMSDESAERELLKLNQAEADVLIHKVSVALGLNKDDAKEVVRRALGDDLFNKTIRMVQYFEVGKGFLAFLLGLLEGIAKSSFSSK